MFIFRLIQYSGPQGTKKKVLRLVPVNLNCKNLAILRQNVENLFFFFVAKCSYFCGIWDFKWQISKMPDMIKLISRLYINLMYQKFNFLSLFNSDPFFLKLKDLLKSLTC